MSNVEFEGENSPSVLYAKFQASNEPPGMVRWLMAHGIAKSPQQANMVLLVIMVVALSVSGFLIMRMNSSGGSQSREAIRQGEEVLIQMKNNL